jgi:hypothetical protein
MRWISLWYIVHVGAGKIAVRGVFEDTEVIIAEVLCKLGAIHGYKHRFRHLCENN